MTCLARAHATVVRAARWPLLLVAFALAGCASLPFFGKDDSASTDERRAAALVPLYGLEIDAPAPLDDLLRANLDVGRFEKGPSTDAITMPELDRLVATTPAQARTLLETEGYFNAEVRAERRADAQGRPVVHVTVVPGPRVTVAAVSVEATGALADAVKAGDATAIAQLADLRAAWPLGPGQPFRQSAWSDAKNAVLARLRARGYASATWSKTDAQIDAVDNRATLRVTADSGPLFRLGAIEVQGIERYTADAAQRLATFGPGTPYDEKILRDYQERLVKSGLFEGATVDIDTDPAQAASAPVRVHVKELTLQQATVGVGYSANTGPRVTLEHYHRRIFGQPWILHDKTELGPDLQSIGGDLTSWPLDDLYRNFVSGNYERLRAADELRNSWNARLGRTRDTTLIERSFYLEATHARVDSAALVTTSDALSGNYQWILRRVDDVLLPTRGYTVNAQGAVGYGKGVEEQRVTAQETHAKGPFSRVYVRWTGYKPLGSWSATTRLEAGQVFSANRISVPDPILFRAGGDDSVRGYGYRTLGPVIDGAVASGRVLATGSFEIAHPISPKYPGLLWATFIDAGNAADRWEDLHAVLGYGVGVRWRSPVGPLRADIAYGQDVRQFRVHVGVGVTF
ncbi:MAG TPA: BamA/TamA family outer membrane protein [Caldimonas sp.]|nr:BamA/TamA family outer membrane protein [Caldimonas sp.]